MRAPRYTIHPVLDYTAERSAWGIYDHEVGAWADDLGRFLTEEGAKDAIVRETFKEEDDLIKVRVLRGIMREEIPRTDYTRALYLAARQARLDGIPDALLRRAVEDLRAEGVIPPE